MGHLHLYLNTVNQLVRTSQQFTAQKITEHRDCVIGNPDYYLQVSGSIFFRRLCVLPLPVVFLSSFPTNCGTVT